MKVLQVFCHNLSYRHDLGRTCHGRKTTCMAHRTIIVDVGKRPLGIFGSIIGLMLVLMVAKMLSGLIGFMQTIGSRHRPTELEW